ncbi:MAG: DUF2059 domain-containing protein [Devosia nanyangense]|uniref:DUF2059 domain-containing protein n=1 Tax=Devosia nanyangense TaxID=1228055 RepID=A0A933L041_9HYPH|nr:DUF2059 domain-containing protein [Devosia nanyangense]
MTNRNLSRLRLWAAPAALALSLAFGAVAPALAQEIPPELLQLARRYVDLTDKAGIYEAVLVQTAAQTSKLLSQSNPEISDKIDAAIGKILEQYKGKKDDLFNQFARVYATTFTQDELTQIVAFYETPAGVKLASSALDINKGIRAVMVVFTNNFGTEFVTKVRAELKAQGYNV